MSATVTVVSKLTQNTISPQAEALAIRLFYAIEDHYRSTDFDRVLQEIEQDAESAGIDLLYLINLVGVRVEHVITQESALVMAIKGSNIHAALKLISLGAKVNVDDSCGGAAVDGAIVRGLDKVVQAMIQADAELLDLSIIGNTLLHRAVTALPKYSILSYGTWKNESVKAQMLKYYNEAELSENLPSPLTVDYEGNVKIIKILASAAPWLLYTKNRNGLTPYEIAQHPIQHQKEFLRAHCLNTEVLEAPKATFQIDFLNRAEDPEKTVSVRVNCDFNHICKYFERISQGLQAHATHIGTQMQEKLEGVEHKVSKVAQKVELIDQPAQEERALQAWLEEPGNENLREFYRIVLISMENLFDGVGAVASKEVDPTAGALSKGAVGLNVVGALAGATIVGAPVEKICTALAAITDAADHGRQTHKATHAAHLGTKDEKAACCKEVAKTLTQILEPSLLSLLTATEAQKQRSSLKKGLKKIQENILESSDFSPAEQVGLFLHTLIRDEIHQARKIDKTKPLAEVLISAALQEPSEDLMATFQSLFSTKVPMWNEGSIVSVSPSDIVAAGREHALDIETTGRQNRIPSDDSSNASSMSKSDSSHTDSNPDSPAKADASATAANESQLKMPPRQHSGHRDAIQLPSSKPPVAPKPVVISEATAANTPANTSPSFTPGLDAKREGAASLTPAATTTTPAPAPKEKSSFFKLPSFGKQKAAA